jgi:hypothetical protein
MLDAIESAGPAKNRERFLAIKLACKARLSSVRAVKLTYNHVVQSDRELRCMLGRRTNG